MRKPEYAEILKEILKQDSRFSAEAYDFVQEALHFTAKLLSKPAAGPDRHVTGVELLEGIRKYALKEYGPLTKTVLNTWGLQRCEDFGAIVFHLVTKGILRKRDEDTIEEFAGGYDFETAFRKPFLSEPRATRKGKVARQSIE